MLLFSEQLSNELLLCQIRFYHWRWSNEHDRKGLCPHGIHSLEAQVSKWISNMVISDSDDWMRLLWQALLAGWWGNTSLERGRLRENYTEERQPTVWHSQGRLQGTAHVEDRGKMGVREVGVAAAEGPASEWQNTALQKLARARFSVCPECMGSYWALAQGTDMFWNVTVHRIDQKPGRRSPGGRLSLLQHERCRQ